MKKVTITYKLIPSILQDKNPIVVFKNVYSTMSNDIYYCIEIRHAENNNPSQNIFNTLYYIPHNVIFNIVEENYKS